MRRTAGSARGSTSLQSVFRKTAKAPCDHVDPRAQLSVSAPMIHLVGLDVADQCFDAIEKFCGWGVHPIQKLGGGGDFQPPFLLAARMRRHAVRR